MQCATSKLRCVSREQTMSAASDVHQWKLIARRALMLGLVMASSSLGFAQWLHYPTAGVPRKTDGKPDLAAPAPRLPDGRPDLSGIWHVANRIPCTPEFNRFVTCGLEIGGSPLALNIGT